MRKHLTLSFLFAVVLTFIGGFIELYSYKTRGIYSAMMTGNMIYIFTNAMDGHAWASIANLLVVLVFFIGCAIGEICRLQFSKHNRSFEPWILILCAICLIPAIAIPVSTKGLDDKINIVADCFLALFGSLMVCAFQEYNGRFYVSTMMTIVLKNITTHGFLAIRDKKKDHIFICLEYLTILFSFLTGVIVFFLIYQFGGAKDNVLMLQLLPLLPLGLLLFVLLPLSFILFKPRDYPDNH